jgi:hypothetical protein
MICKSIRLTLIYGLCLCGEAFTTIPESSDQVSPNGGSCSQDQAAAYNVSTALELLQRRLPVCGVIAGFLGNDELISARDLELSIRAQQRNPHLILLFQLRRAAMSASRSLHTTAAERMLRVVEDLLEEANSVLDNLGTDKYKILRSFAGVYLLDHSNSSSYCTDTRAAEAISSVSKWGTNLEVDEFKKVAELCHALEGHFTEPTYAEVVNRTRKALLKRMAHPPAFDVCILKGGGFEKWIGSEIQTEAWNPPIDDMTSRYIDALASDTSRHFTRYGVSHGEYRLKDDERLKGYCRECIAQALTASTNDIDKINSQILRSIRDTNENFARALDYSGLCATSFPNTFRALSSIIEFREEMKNHRAEHSLVRDTLRDIACQVFGTSKAKMFAHDLRINTKMFAHDLRINIKNFLSSESFRILSSAVIVLSVSGVCAYLAPIVLHKFYVWGSAAWHYVWGSTAWNALD